MSIFISRGTLNQPDLAHRDKVNRREDYISHAEKKPCFDHNFSALPELSSLAEKMIFDAYSQKKSSEEIMREFFMGTKNLRKRL